MDREGIEFALWCLLRGMPFDEEMPPAGFAGHNASQESLYHWLKGMDDRYKPYFEKTQAPEKSKMYDQAQ